MAQTIAVLSQKGGTGKTTTVRTLTDVFRKVGVKTLAVDLDPQGNLSDYFDVPPDVEPTVADVLAGASAAREAIHEDVIPASLNLAETELMLGGKIGREMTLRRALADVKDEYEIVLVDCPPSLGLLTVNALVAADYALVTAEAQYFALQGVEQALEVIEVARDSLNDELELVGVLLNLADMSDGDSRGGQRTSLHRNASGRRCSRRPCAPRSRTPEIRLSGLSRLSKTIGFLTLGADYVAPSRANCWSDCRA